MILILLLVSFLLGCANTAQAEADKVAGNVGVAGLEKPVLTPADTPTATSTPAPTASVTPLPVTRVLHTATVSPTATFTPSLMITVIPTATTSPTTTFTPAPTLSATSLPSTAIPPTATASLTMIASTTDISAAEPAIDGLAVYKSQYCGICHQLKAANSAGIFGPSHDGLGLTAAQRIQDPDYTGIAVTPAEYIRESILIPETYLAPGFEFSIHRMPPYTYLTEAEIQALVQFLLQQ